MKTDDGTRLLLHNLRSVANVGTIFRTAECAGVAKIYLTGYTPAPVDRFGRKRKDFHKAALGAEDLINWEEAKDIHKLIRELKKDSFSIIALEQSPMSVDYKKIKRQKKMAIVIGNEVDGLPRDVLDTADQIAEIPLRGKKESLNVAVATGIFLFRLLDTHS